MESIQLCSILLVCCVLNIPNAESNLDIDGTTVTTWAKDFGDRLTALSIEYSGIDKLRENYEAMSNSFKVEKIDGVEMTKQISEAMNEMLENKVKAVEKLVEAAEVANFNSPLADNKEEFTPEDVSYYNAMLINKWNNDSQEYYEYNKLGGEFLLESDEHFNKIEVNITQSTVQVPTNVYNREDKVLRDIDMTEALDVVFSENYENDPTLTWQYFGSYTGFFRNYPGIEWSVDNVTALDLFDCRDRGWYIQAATSPKNIVILVDTSGSMLGLRNDIAKHTVQTLIDTLGDDDFFNVMQFDQETRYLEECFNDTLVQANSDNKELVKQKLDNIEPGDIADIGNALIKAFELLEKFNSTGNGSGCNQAIMLLTDGATEKYESLFEQYNADQRVRLFTYAIGREVKYSPMVSEMACNNKGYFTQIRTIADVQENVSKYIHVLSRPMVIKQSHDTVWTNVYMDTAGLALMTTVAQPVFNKKNESFDQGILLGVVGTDVPVFELRKLTPPYKLGVNGYSFAVTNNGYLLFHPDLRPLYGPNDSLKPNYNSVDLAEVELSEDREILRTAMVDRKEGHMNMEVKVHTSNLRRAVERNNSYYYIELKDTPFSLGIVLVNDYGHYYMKPEMEINQEGLEYLMDDDIALAQAGSWRFCQLTNAEAKTMTKLEGVIQKVNESFINANDPNYTLKCDEELIKHVLFGANVTANLPSYWQGKFQSLEIQNTRIDNRANTTNYKIDDNLKKRNQTSGTPGDSVVLQFVGTSGGLTRYYWNPRSALPSDFIEENSNSLQEDYFTRATVLGNGNFLYSVPFDAATTYNDTLVTASSVVFVQNAPAAAAGIQFKLSFLQDIFNNVTSNCTTEEDCMKCSDDGVECYLLDNDAYIISSTYSDKIGTHFSEHRPSVMSELAGEDGMVDGVYKKIIITDFQGMCEREENIDNAGSILLDPFFSVTAYIRWLTHYVILKLVQFSVYDWLYSGVLAETASFHNAMSSFYPCDKVHPFFTHDPEISSTSMSDSIICDNCEILYNIEAINGTNLFLLVIKSETDCDCPRNTTSFLPEEKIYNTTEKCARIQVQRHRRRPETCHAYHEQEDSKECGGCTTIQASLILMFIAVIFATHLPLQYVDISVQ
ncbi:voltage-dependent calcium channel subunit alpha-2/delta-3-like isoform X2 [Glandiceps talaboti]